MYKNIFYFKEIKRIGRNGAISLRDSEEISQQRYNDILWRGRLRAT